MSLRIVIICINLMSMAIFAAHQDMTPTDRVNKILSEHPELYDFNSDEYSGENNADKRLDKFNERKNRIIQNELLAALQVNIKTIIKKNTFSLLGCKIDRRPVGKFFNNLIDICSLSAASALWPSDIINLPAKLLKKAFGLLKIPIDAACDPPSYRSKVSELKDQIKDISRVLKHNTLNDTEKEVVSRWHEFPEGMKETLINNLLLLRSPHKSVRDLTAARQKIEYCLNVPTKSKPLIPDSEGDDIDEFTRQNCVFMDTMFANPPWSRYPAATKEQLKTAISEMCKAPFKESLGYKTSRKIWYFHGKPGTGKSKAAKEIAAKFDLPVIEIGSSTSDELSQKNLTGNSAFELEKKLGLLFQPLFAKDKNRQNYKNAVVIIDDFDRLLRKGVPPFLLWLFDPDTKEVKCDYLGKEVFLDISQITFILTANTDLGQNAANESGGQADQFGALRDRLLFVHFDQFSGDSLDELLKEHIRSYGILRFSDLFENSEENLDKIVEFALANNPDQGIRELRRIVEGLANNSRNTWDGKLKIGHEEAPGANRRDPAPKQPSSAPMQSSSGINNIFDLINAKTMINAGWTGKNINAAVVDTGIDFENELLKNKELKIDDIQFSPPNNLEHGTNTALILAGISPDLKIASYWDIGTHEAIEHAKKLDVKIANVSIVGQAPASLHFGFNEDIADIAVVVIAGNDEQQETTMAKNLGNNYYPEHKNIIVTVAVDSRGNLTPQSSACGKTKNFCVAVPSLGATSETAPIVSGALAMLMEAHPGLTAENYVEAILKTASTSHAPNNKTGMGMLNVGAAYQYLISNSPMNPGSFQNPPPNQPTTAAVQNTNADAGKIRIIAGTGTAGKSRSHSPLRNELNEPRAIAVAADGHIYFTEIRNHRVLRISPDGKTIERFAGTGYAGKKLSTKDRKATELNRPCGIALQHDGDVVVADSLNSRLLLMRPNVTCALYKHGWSTPSWLNSKMPLAARNLVADAHDILIAADPDNHRIVGISYKGNEVWTIAGTRQAGSQLRSTAKRSELNTPRGVAITPNGEIIIADTNNHRIVMLSKDRKSINCIAGCGQGGSTIIKNDPKRSKLMYPVAVAVNSKGSILIADTHNHRILELSPDHKTIKSIVGTGQRGSGLNKDNPMATSLREPGGIAVTRDDGILIADTGNHRILRLDIAEIP